MVGLDSITPLMVDRFMAEGRMPNLRRLTTRGWRSDTISTMPPTTPTAWTTIATGAWPQTHGIEGFVVRDSTGPPDCELNACSSERIRAELLWEAAERAGLGSILLKFPMSWPPRGGDGVIQVDGAAGWGGLKCVWDLAQSACWSTQEQGWDATDAGQVPAKRWLTRDQDNLDEESVRLLPILRPSSWESVPPNASSVWCSMAAIGDDPTAIVHLLAFRVGSQDRVAVSGHPDFREAKVFTEGEWTTWLPVTFDGVAGSRTGHVRFKVMCLDVEAQQLRLYQSQVHQQSGYSRPESVATALDETVGPFVEWTESYDRLKGWIDDETQLEIYAQHTRWMAGAARHLIETHPWDLFLTQVHFLDMAYHVYWGGIDPRHPEYDPASAERYWGLLGAAHELADDLLGAIVGAAGEDALVVVLGDHGHDVYHTSFLINNHLLAEGYLTVSRDRRTGRPVIDWKRSVAFAQGYRIYLNVAGRDPSGIVPSKDYERCRAEIAESLTEVTDSLMKQRPLKLVLTREDAVSWGLGGASMGDLVVATSPGYQVKSVIRLDQRAWIGATLRRDNVGVFRRTKMFRDFTGEHDSSLPLTRPIHSVLIAAGDRVRHGRSPHPLRLVDVAPTLADYLGMPPPRDCEGSSFLHHMIAPA